MKGFAAARQAMMGIQEEYKKAECDPSDFVFDLFTEELEEADQELDDPHYAFLEEEDQDFLEKWLANPENFMSLKSIGKPFEKGAKFVPICGDGNCFFSACSTY